MSDARTRGLERRWRETGDPNDGRRYLRERLRQGDTEIALRALMSGHFEATGYNEQGFETFRHIESRIDFVAVPAGTFEMGSMAQQACQPVHTVTFERPFLMSVSHVTQDEWTRVMGENPARHQGTSASPIHEGKALDRWGQPWGDHPVDSVSWDDVQVFCDRTGLRLPTEAMYEYCARAGARTRYHHGDSVEGLSEYAWFGAPENTSHRATRQLRPNAWGLYDMVGNVLSWTQCLWHQNYDGAPTNGFVAWGDVEGYNHALWLTGTLEELILAGFAAKPIEDVLSADEDEEEDLRPARRVRYGLSVKIVPPLGRPQGAPTNKPQPRARVDRTHVRGVESVEQITTLDALGGQRTLRVGPDPTQPDGRPHSGATSSSQPATASRSSDGSPSKRSDSSRSNGPASPDSASPEDAPGQGKKTSAPSSSAISTAGLPTPDFGDSEWSGLEHDPADDIPLNVPSVSLLEGHRDLERLVEQDRVLRGEMFASAQAPAIWLQEHLADLGADYTLVRFGSREYLMYLEHIGFRVVWG